MKYQKIKIYTLTILVMASVGCRKYLEKAPDNRAKLSDVEKVAQLLVSAYPKADYYSFAENASDNAEWKGNGVGDVTDKLINFFNWEDFTGGEAQGTVTYFWNSAYAAIAASNQALDAIKINGDGKEYQVYKGEALLCRAFSHFLLSIFFTKNYVPGGGNNSPGVPYVTEPETVVIKQYNRSTVAALYENIEKDLLAGLPLINNSAYKVLKYHFNIAAANAFAARFYLFKGDYDKAIDYATKTVPGGNWIVNLRPWTTTYRTATSAEMLSMFTDVNQKATLLLIDASSTWGRDVRERVGFGQQLNNKIFGANNVTGKQYYQRIWNYGVPHYTFIKFDEYFYSTGPGIGIPYLMMPVLTVDETLLNRAEAYARKDQFSLALKDLNTFLTTRIQNFSTADEVTEAKVITYYAPLNVKNGIIEAILDAKRAEFMQEGLRWFDLVRLDKPVQHLITNDNGAITSKILQPGDPRRLFQIPDEAKLSGVEKNPR